MGLPVLPPRAACSPDSMSGSRAGLPEPRNRVFSQIKLSGKIVGTIVVVLACTSVLSFWITQRRINQQAEEAFRDKVRQITGMASTTREWFSDNLDTLVPNGSFKDLNQVPVVAAWRVAQEVCQRQRHDIPHALSQSPQSQEPAGRF